MTSMTLEELKAGRKISNTDGRPVSWLTDELWQKEIEIRKSFITHVKTKKMNAKYATEGAKKGDVNYHGPTQFQSYCSYINDVLRNIRKGEVDYCYFIYQIEDLLRFHYNDLRTRYCDGYWEVWLEK